MEVEQASVLDDNVCFQRSVIGHAAHPKLKYFNISCPPNGGLVMFPMSTWRLGRQPIKHTDATCV